MKKLLAVFIAVLILCGAMSGCNGEIAADYTYSFDGNTFARETVFDLNASGNVVFRFELPEKGAIKMVAYDATDYEIWPDEIPGIFVDFKNENGKTLFENVQIDSGYISKYIFEKGSVFAEIKIENKPEKMKKLAVSWAYAVDNLEPAYLELENETAAVADENGVARFSLYVDKPSLVRVYPAEACIYESDCSFYIETANGERATGDLSIHGTEWSSRLAFLDKGEYVIVVSGIDAVASCKVKAEKTYTAIQLDDADGMTVPVAFGLNNLNSGERNVKFVADGSEKYFVVETKGSGTFYDSVHCVEVVITDESGKVVAQSDEEYISDETVIDISGLKGEYTATLSASGTCVMEVAIIDK